MIRVFNLKLSIFCFLLSLWGIVMLPVMGFFLYTHSVAFAEDLGIHAEEIHSKSEFHGEADHRFTQAAYNCWIAACLYVVTLAASLHQIYMNRVVQVSRV